MNDIDVWKEVTRWTKAKTGLPVIRGWQGEAPPPRPYVMVNLLSTNEVRDHEVEVLWDADVVGVDEVMAHVAIETEWRFSIFAYSETPSDVLRPLRAVSRLSQATEPLYPGLIIHDMSMIRNVPDFQNEDWEPRAQVDFNVRGMTRDGALVNVIEEHTPAIFTRT